MRPSCDTKATSKWAWIGKVDVWLADTAGLSDDTVRELVPPPGRPMRAAPGHYFAACRRWRGGAAPHLRPGGGKGISSRAGPAKHLNRPAHLNPQLRKTGISGILALSGLLLAVQFCTSCCTTAPFPSVDLSEPGWRVQQGQAIWKLAKNKPELAGEVTLARHPDGRCLVEFSKTPFPLVRAKVSATRWAIEFPPQKLHFSGGGRPPARLAWLHLMRGLTGQPVSAPWQFELRPNGGWRLENPRRGESVEGYLEP